MRDLRFEDPVRLAARPERRLRIWEQTWKPLDALVDAPLAGIGLDLSRSVLVAPLQSLDAAGVLVERLVAAASVSPETCLSIADSFNALACAGVPLPDVARERVVAWLPALTSVEPPFPGRIRAGFAALAYGDDRRAAYVAPVPRGDLEGGLEFPNDMLALLGYAIAGVRARAGHGMLENALARVGESLDDLCADAQFDEATALWLARMVFHRMEGQSLGTVATRAHDWLWSIPTKLEADRRTAATARAEFPVGRTLAGGAYRVEQWLRGLGAQRLYRGTDVSRNSPVLISLDNHYPGRQRIDELSEAVAYAAPGLFDVAHVGTFDGDDEHWAIVERVPEGDWLPRVLGPAHPWTASRKAIELGATAGEILWRAAADGILLTQIRPEFMWAQHSVGRFAVTGLSTRPFDLFRRARGDAFTRPLFERWYRAPEAGEDADDRAVTFSLSVMIAEWATGQYPLRSSFGMETTDHDPIETSSALRTLLEAGLRASRDERPWLADFVRELRRLAASMGPS